jgi:hypothetical protein
MWVGVDTSKPQNIVFFKMLVDSYYSLSTEKDLTLNNHRAWMLTRFEKIY